MIDLVPGLGHVAKLRAVAMISQKLSDLCLGAKARILSTAHDPFLYHRLRTELYFELSQVSFS